MSVDLDDLKPFIAPLLMESSKKKTGRDLIKDIVKDVQAQVRTTPSREREVLKTTKIEADGENFYQAVIYQEKGAPAWIEEGHVDTVHHLVVVSVRGKYAAICASDGMMRDKIAKNSPSIRRVSRSIIAKFIGPVARSLWLNGVHTPTAAKPDTKAMTGVSLEHAIDPIGDQSYYYSAVRSTPDVKGLKNDDAKSIPVGAAPAAARVWVNRAQGWPDFKARISAIFDHALSATVVSDPFSALSKPVDSAAGVSNAYAISVVPPDLLSEDYISAADLQEAQRWSYYASYKVTASAGLSLTVEPSLDGNALGELELAVDMVDEAVAIQSQWKNKAPGKNAECRECERYLSDPEIIKIYYDSGHTIAQGRCYEGGYSDQPFDREHVDFSGYDITKEKPTVAPRSTLAKSIAVKGDDSLFAYVVEKMFTDSAGKPTGWLASDDGSMELADFIHIDPTDKVVTLVHIKASSTDDPGRQASTGDYELVVSQAVKNLRHLDRRKLGDELRKGKGKKIGDAVWLDGVKQSDRNGFLQIVDKLPASARRVLVVLQPRITQREVNYCASANASRARSLRMKQINTMMLAARSSAANCGALFRGITAK